MKKSGIYCIENMINSKKYIGQSVNIYSRWAQHKNELNDNKHSNDYLQKSWNKYGSDNFNFYVIEFCDIDKLDEREIYYINFYKTLDRDKGYNLMSGGTFGRKYSTESRIKMSQSLNRHRVTSKTRIKISKNHVDINGENNPMYGKHHTEETRRKVSEANKGKISKRRNRNTVFCIELERTFEDATEAGKELNLDGSAILKCCRGERKTCGGYHWKFVDLENNIS